MPKLVDRLRKAGPGIAPLIKEYLELEGVLPRNAKPGAERRSFSNAADRERNPDVARAMNALKAGKVTGSADDVKEVTKRLKDARYFDVARQFVALARQDQRLAEHPKLKKWLPQQHGLCTYKDVNLPIDSRLDRALRVLDNADPLVATTDPETLGIAGAIFKTKWLRDGQLQHLEQSLAYYLRGYDLGVENDYGYTGINAAYILDLLASEAEPEGTVAKARRDQARTIRTKIASELPKLLEKPENDWLRTEWWFPATIAEACFGLGIGEDAKPDETRYEEARYWIREALALNVSDWEYQSTVRQIVDLARVQKIDRDPLSPAMRTLRLLLGENMAGIDNLQHGKVGLALSGGGFRASLFHIGVLARLAELNILRHVEVLSCVSGGSIVGAHYYLEVRQHLNQHPDLSREDAISIVRKLQRDFLAGIQRDLRNRLLASWWTSFRLVFSPNFSQTARLGEMFEEALYSRVVDGKRGEFWLDELTIHPPDAPQDFSPKVDNWRRNTKVPILILNATTLNTGHNWQFTATWMGESPNAINSEIDANERLRRLYYKEAPDPYKKFRLGHAVAASAAVPVLFDPLELPGLYPNRLIRLSDGGVHDNQGIAGLLEQECNVLLISDASGQLGTEARPKSGHFDVLWRANGILQERIRWGNYDEVDARRSGGVLRGVMFVHLNKDLEVRPVAWMGNTDPPEPPDDPAARVIEETEAGKTSYGMLKRVQRMLASARTDLDAFSEEEAYALMLSGYRMVNREFPSCIRGFPVSESTEIWDFEKVAPLLDDPEAKPKILPAADRTFGKVWRLLPGLKVAAIAAAIVGFAEIVWLASLFLGPISRLGVMQGFLIAAAAIAFAALLIVILRGILALLGIRKSLSQVAIGLFSLTIGWLIARFHLWLVRPWYLERGKVSEHPSRAPTWRLAGAMTAVLLLVAVSAGLLTRYGRPLAISSATRVARLHQEQRNYEKALASWSRALAFDPSNAEARVQRADVNVQLQRLGSALSDYNWAINQGKNVYAARAYVQRQLGNYPEAADDYEEALRREPKNPQHWRDLGYARRLIGDLEGARSAYKTALTFGPAPQASADLSFVNKLLPESVAVPGLSIFVVNKDTRLSGLISALGVSHIFVPSVKLANPWAMPSQTELRYFRPEDREEGERLQAMLSKLKLDAKPVLYIDTKVRPHQYELWLSKDPYRERVQPASKP